MLIRDTYDIIALSLCIIAILLNIYILIIIFTVSPKSMNEYRRFIALYTVDKLHFLNESSHYYFQSWDGAFSFFTGIMLQPRLYFPATGCVSQGVSKDLYDLFGPKTGEILAKFCVCIFNCPFLENR